MQLYPFLFRPVYRDYLWGGTRIAECYARTDAPSCCAESWEISAHPDGSSLVANGPLAGRDLQSLSDEFGEALLGSACDGTRFPLLIKLIDARQKLSVQVHPSEETAEAVGGEPKTEMWYLLGAEPNAEIYCGLQNCPGPRTLRDALTEHRVPSLLVAHPSVVGRAMFVPGGTVHAIGDGNLIYEVQQSSNTTYRVFDWDRVGADGKARALHVDQAISVIRFRAPSQGFLPLSDLPAFAPTNQRKRILRSDFFELTSTLLRETEPVTMDGFSFHALFVESGEVRLSWGDGDAESLTLAHGTSCLVPAALKSYSLSPLNGEAKVLTTTL